MVLFEHISHHDQGVVHHVREYVESQASCDGREAGYKQVIHLAELQGSGTAAEIDFCVGDCVEEPFTDTLQLVLCGVFEIIYVTGKFYY